MQRISTKRESWDGNLQCSFPELEIMVKGRQSRDVDGAEWDCTSGRKACLTDSGNGGGAYSGSRWVSVWAAVKVW